MNTRKKHLPLLIISILCFIATALFAFCFLALAFNFFGVNDLVRKIYLDMMITPDDIDFQITLKCIEFIISILAGLHFALFYLKAYKFITYQISQLGKAMIYKSIFQILFGFYITGILALVFGIVYSNRKQVTPITDFEDKDGIPAYKLEAMSEAVARLKKLREVGAISEEEYYLNLNKILES